MEPAAQTIQSSSASLPVTPTYFPAVHPMQSLLAELPMVVEYFPASHDMQSSSASLAALSTNLPAIQSTQPDSALRAGVGEYFPARHSMQSAASLLPDVSAYFPASQSMHASLETVLNFPASHRVHEVPPVFASVSVNEPASHSMHPAVPTESLYRATLHASQVLEGVDMVPVYPGSHRQADETVDPVLPPVVESDGHSTQTAVPGRTLKVSAAHATQSLYENAPPEHSTLAVPVYPAAHATLPSPLTVVPLGVSTA